MSAAAGMESIMREFAPPVIARRRVSSFHFD
jgi:hypothetical protein